MIRDHYTTIVVGAGPAGVMAALHASDAGSVLLLESMDLPRDKSCGGMLNEYSQEFLSRFGTLPSSMVCDPEWICFRFFDWDRNIKKGTSLRFRNVVRREFDAWLMELLPDNVTVAGSTRLRTLSQDVSGVNAGISSAGDASAPIREVHADYLIGCDGPRSTTRRLLNEDYERHHLASDMPVDKLHLYKTLQDYVPASVVREPFFDCLYSRNIGDGNYGYGYVIPKGEEFIIGSVFYPGAKDCLSTHIHAVDTYRNYFGYGDEVLKREAWTAVKVKTTDDIIGGVGRVLLAGEAGGIMSPSSGEGISFALNSGTYAGCCVAAFYEAPKPSTGSTTEIALTAPQLPSEAVSAYKQCLGPIKKNIKRRLRLFPVIDSDWGKYVGGSMPLPVVDKLAHII